MFAFRRSPAAGPREAELHPGAAGLPELAVCQLCLSGIHGVLDGRPPCRDPGIEGLCATGAQVSDLEGPAETRPNPLLYQEPEAQRAGETHPRSQIRGRLSSNYTFLTQLGLVLFWEPHMASLPTCCLFYASRLCSLTGLALGTRGGVAGLETSWPCSRGHQYFSVWADLPLLPGTSTARAGSKSLENVE